MAGRTFASLDGINQELRSWCLKMAGLRIHGTTRKRPFEVFQAVERAALILLPAEPFEIATWVKAKVGRATLRNGVRSNRRFLAPPH